MKRIPEAVSNFEVIRRDNYLYIDKTRFINEYEKLSPVTVFLRPRRFGKTLFTEILRYYYDLALKEKGGALLKDTWIASNPTPYKNGYRVVKLDFSGIQSNHGAEYALEKFRLKIVDAVIDFFELYPDLIHRNYKGKSVDERLQHLYREYSNSRKYRTASDVLEQFIRDLRFYLKDGYNLFFIIDEYDNFTNDMLASDPGVFSEIARKDGDFGGFFNVLRFYCQKGLVSRVFVTGVLPVTLDTAVSCFVSSKISYVKELNALAGFTEKELAGVIAATVDLSSGTFSEQELIREMKRRYNGYRFAPGVSESVFNPSLCLNFINGFNNQDQKSLPPFSVSSSCDVDYLKLNCFLELINDQDRDSIVDHVLGQEPIPAAFAGSLKRSFQDQKFNFNEGATLLYHLGFLTFASSEVLKNKNLSSEYLTVPNEYFRLLFTRYYYLRHHIGWNNFEGQYNLSQMQEANSILPLRKILESLAGAFIKTDNTNEGESHIALAVYTAFSLNAGHIFELTREYYVRHNGRFPLEMTEGRDGTGIISLKKGRADLVAINRKSGPSYLFEFKYQRDTKSSKETKEKTVQKLMDEATSQIRFYVTDDRLKQIADLHKYVIMYVYGEFVIRELQDL